MIKTYNYNDNVKLSEHFSASEFRCKCGKSHEFKVDDSLVSNLEKLFSKLDCSKIIVTSGYRCVQHDKNVGGSGSGQHVEGTAADICCYGQDGNPISSKLVCCTAQDIGFKGIANINTSYQYTHVDMRVNGKWYGDETVNYNTVTDDFYKYFKIKKGDDTKMDEPVNGVKRGIDISWCQTSVDWSKVNVDFAIIQVGGGEVKREKDKMFESHYAGAKSKGIPVGAYWFLRATTAKEAVEEADICLSLMREKQFEYPIYVDIETDAQLKLGKDKLTEVACAFIERVESAGYWVGLYMSGFPMKDGIKGEVLKRFAVWVADTRGVKVDYIDNFGMWQYSWKGNIDGIKGDVDLDYCYVDYPSAIKANGLNGFSKDDTKPAPTTDKDTIDVEVKFNGKTYKGTLEA